MRNLDADLSAEFAKSVFTYFHMVELYLTSGTYRYTDFQYDLYSGGNKYTPKGLDIGAVGSNLGLAIDKMTFELDDTDLTVSALFLGEDVRYKRVSIYKGAIDANYEIIAIDEFFRGVIESWELPEPRAKITIANELIKWKDKTLRTASATCPWVFNKPPHTNLLTTDWTNGLEGTGTYLFDTFTYSTHNITSAISVSPGRHVAWSGYFPVERCKLYTLIIDLTLNSGTAPTINYAINADLNSWANEDIPLADGENTFVWMAQIDHSYEYIYLSNMFSSDFSLTMDIYEVTECAYLGSEAWCDQSYARCCNLGNSGNFGGFRFLPSLMEKDIWWGRVPKK